MKIHLGTFFGIPLFLHWSWFLILPFVAFMSGIWAIPTVLLLFFFVVLHEYGHCLAAMYFDVTPRYITLYPLGGVASMPITGVRPLQEFVVTIAGPAVNLLFFLLSTGACFILPGPQEFTDFADLWKQHPFFMLFLNIAIVNFMLGAFNMLPMFPMDGGRMLRSIICGITGNYYISTLIAVRLGQLLCVVGFMLAIYTVNILLCITMVIVALAGQQELVLAQYCSSIQSIRFTVACMLGRADLHTATIPELIEAIEDEEDEEVHEALRSHELLLLLRDAVEEDKSE